MGAPKIKFPNFNEAGLSFVELEELAKEIHDVILKGKGVTFSDYIKLAKNVTPLELGVRKTNALKHESKLHMYFPDKVLKILRTKASERKFHRFNKDDDKYLLGHQAKGSVWLAQRFYVSHHVIIERSALLGIKLPSYFHQYTKKEDQFIRNNLHKGLKWISVELDVSVKSVGNRIRNLKNPRKFKKHNYTKKDERYIQKNMTFGYKKLAEHFNASVSSVRGKVKRMKECKLLNENR
jgi:hypothetical protein